MTPHAAALDDAQRALFDRLRAMLERAPVVVVSAPPRTGLRTVAAALARELSYGQGGADLAVITDDTPDDPELRGALLASAHRALVIESSLTPPAPARLAHALALADALGALPTADRDADRAFRDTALAGALAAIARTAPALAAAWEDHAACAPPTPDLIAAARAHAASVAALRDSVSGRVLRLDPPPAAAATPHPIEATGDAELPHYLVIRCAAELAALDLAPPGGSYSGLLSGDDGREARRRLRGTPRGAAALEMLAHVLDESADPDHPELAALLAHALDAAREGEKLLAVCASPTAARRLCALLTERLAPAPRSAPIPDRLLSSALAALGPDAGYRAADLRLTSDELPELARLLLAHGTATRLDAIDPALVVLATEHLVARRILPRLDASPAAPLVARLAALDRLPAPLAPPDPGLVDDLVATLTDRRLKEIVCASAAPQDDPAPLHAALWELTDPDDLALRTRALAVLGRSPADPAAALAFLDDLAQGRVVLDFDPDPAPRIALIDARTPAPAAHRALTLFATPADPRVLILTGPPAARIPLHRHCRHLAIQGAADTDALDPGDLARLLTAPGALAHRTGAPVRVTAPYLTGLRAPERLARRARARQLARIPGVRAHPRAPLPPGLFALFD